MHLPIRPLVDRWPYFLQSRFARFFWEDPRVILDENVTPEQFRKAMSAVQVGSTIKITGGNRHPAADDLLIDNIALDDATIVDIGASDGSTSVDLIGKLPAFGQYIIADLYFHIRAVTAGSHTLFYDNDDVLILVVGRRAIAWPAGSAFVRFLYSGLARRARLNRTGERDVLLLNPAARELIQRDPRVSYRVHDVFQPWDGPRPTVIKVANLLRRLYFSDERIANALVTILRSLDDDAYFLVVDNPRIKGISSRAGLYQRQGGRFVTVAETVELPEIKDLIESVSLDEQATS